MFWGQWQEGPWNTTEYQLQTSSLNIAFLPQSLEEGALLAGLPPIPQPFLLLSCQHPAQAALRRRDCCWGPGLHPGVAQSSEPEVCARPGNSLRIERSCLGFWAFTKSSPLPAGFLFCFLMLLGFHWREMENELFEWFIYMKIGAIYRNQLGWQPPSPGHASLVYNSGNFD